MASSPSQKPTASAATPEAIQLAADDVRAALHELAPGLAELPIVPCSALTGDGLPALTAAIRKLAAAIPPRSLRDRPIVPIDRVFAVKGHGTVATGTLLSGRSTSPQAAPSSSSPPVPTVNLASSAPAPSTSAAPPANRPPPAPVSPSTSATSRTDDLAPRRRDLQRPPRHPQPILPRGSSPTSPTTSTSGAAAAPSSSAPAQPTPPSASIPSPSSTQTTCPQRQPPNHAAPARPSHLAPPPWSACASTPRSRLWHGQRLVLRSARSNAATRQHGHTVGGGILLDPTPGSGRGQRPRWLDLARALRDPEPAARVRALLQHAGALGTTRDELERRAGVVDLDPVLTDMRIDKQALALGEPRWVDAAVLGPLAAAAAAHVARFQEAHPLQPGLGRAAAVGGLPGRVAPDVAAAAVAHAVACGLLRADGDLLTRPATTTADPGLPPKCKPCSTCSPRRHRPTHPA